MYSKIISGAIHGVDGRLIIVEADVSDGLPMLSMVGFLASEVKEASDRVKSAIRNSGYRIPPKRITINLSPADVRKQGSAFDLPISIALLVSCGYIPFDNYDDTIMIGELSLNGDLRPVRGILPIISYAKQMNIHNVILPYENRIEAACVPGLQIYGAKNLKEVVSHLNREQALCAESYHNYSFKENNTYEEDFSEVKGQHIMKRVVEIAVAGMHNLLIIGPPGAGKSMIAKRIPTIMPMLTYDESVELSKIYSVSGLLGKDVGLINKRPFRMPHHSITTQALIGGGQVPKPGEISLAHNGILFLDEFLEFNKNTMEMMRQPLEDGKIVISRLNGSYEFPSDFMLVAAMNPCPCGFYPDRNRCHCNDQQILRYFGKLSNPMLDRIDMNITVKRLMYEELYKQDKEESSKDIKQRIETVHLIQKNRYKKEAFRFNSQITASKLDEICQLGRSEELLRKDIFEKYELSARGINKIMKVARTIADLDNSEEVKEHHIYEALSYRTPDYFKEEIR